MYQITKLVWIFLCFALISCSSNDDKEQIDSEQVLYEKAQKRLNSGQWDSAIETLQLLEEYFPFGYFAEQAQLELIYAQYKADEQDLAIAAADRFIRLHPQSRNVDYAYYMRGVAAFHNDSAFVSMLPTDTTSRDPGTASDAFNYFAQLINRFPESKYALDAQKRMTFIRNAEARYEIHVANYYFKRGAYLAAANRGKYVVENLQRSPAVPDALAVMAQAYHLLGMDELSNNAVKVLQHNYPKHPTLGKDGDFNFQFGRDQKRSWINYLTLGLFEKRKYPSFDSRKQYNPFYSDKGLEPPQRG
ncbi:outer membrane protein assembly factor BamD [Teredinibacter sp. KSP-S5-2]|uniref:outer membrane protein assembly factor BamD n=1 Tax=Teredinibacter sp. KSP-S5-2 TaxID=3034506 RepID=UPI002934CA4A|nr:outer membrane protein assembly factor BamD [Teredinibacter sp. KSP-S5-2]WNO09870.1 outer membrane protein assembly factor BamD [Teredinibacter sp. KSP-S5-2]